MIGVLTFSRTRKSRIGSHRWRNKGVKLIGVEVNGGHRVASGLLQGFWRTLRFEAAVVFFLPDDFGIDDWLEVRFKRQIEFGNLIARAVAGLSVHFQGAGASLGLPNARTVGIARIIEGDGAVSSLTASTTTKEFGESDATVQWVFHFNLDCPTVDGILKIVF